MPSRISVVLVEEAKVRGTEYSVSPGVDQDPRLLPGASSPASVTVGEGGRIYPCVVVDSVGPVGACGTLSPSESVDVGLVGPYGTLSPSDSDGPVGPYGTLFP